MMRAGADLAGVGLDFTGIRSTIYKWARNVVTPTRVIWARQAEDRPPKPYVTLDFLVASMKRGDDDLRQENNGDMTAVGLREMTITINAFGTEAYDLLTRLQGSLELPGPQEVLLEGGIVAIATSSIQDISMLMESRFETRAQMDVRFRVLTENVDTTTDIIESVTIENEILGESLEIQA